MNTNLSINPIIKQNVCNKVQNKGVRKNTPLIRDSFAISPPENKQISFGGLFSSLFVKKTVKPAVNTEDENLPQFTKELARNVNKAWETNFPARNFSCVVSADEFREILPTLNRENFELTDKNLNSGCYCADLDNQTNFSNGTETIFSMMDKVANFANKYHENTGKDFIFALTDRDSLDGVKQAMRLIGENPGKYRHVKFVPGIKMSFAHRAPSSSSVGYENSEMLIYGINPYSENLNEFLDSVIHRRKGMVADFIKSVHNLYPQFAYNIKEFTEQNGLIYKKDFTESNLYWRAKEYSEKKGGDKITGNVSAPEQIFEDAESIFDELDKVYIGSDLSGSVSSLSSENQDESFNLEIQQIFDQYSTRYDYDEHKEVSAAENIYIDLIECLKKEEQKPVMAIAAPYYFSHYFENSQATKTYDNVINFFNVLKEQSEGMLCAFESIVPSYGLDKILGEDTVKNFNDYLRNSPNCNFYEVGGSFHRVTED